LRTTERLDKLLARAGYGTRSEIKRLVREGAVSVNGVSAGDSGMRIDPEKDRLAVHGEPVVVRDLVYVMLHKPRGVVCATEDLRHRTVLDLVDGAYRRLGVFPVGRLDKDTEGLLLLTNDGKLAHRLLSPRKHVPKTYYAEVEGEVDAQDADAFARGIPLDDGYVTLPARLDIVQPGSLRHGVRSRIELTITEGKFHQVKRMFAARGKRVVYLKRLSMGPLSLDPSLTPGQYRELTDDEVSLLKSYQTSETDGK
jgi:16S rRNA pseudouridine516 synthase